MEVIANQHIKHDGVMHAPEGFEGHDPEGFELPDEVAERMIRRGSVRDLKAPPPSVASAPAEPAPAAPAPAEFNDEQRRMLLRAAIITLVKAEEGLTGDGKPKVDALENASGVNTNARERDELFAELYPEEPDDGEGGRGGDGS